jgi:hypothetical protein
MTMAMASVTAMAMALLRLAEVVATPAATEQA